MNMDIKLSDQASPFLEKYKERLTSDGVKNAAGQSVRRLLMSHLGELDSSRANTMGGARSHYYADAARGVNYEINATGADVAIHWVGIRLHLEGGTVTPVNKKYLTIPARAESYNRRAGEFEDLQVLWGRNGPYALAAVNNDDKSKRRSDVTRNKETKKLKGRSSLVFFWLCKSATMQPDPEVLPSKELITDAVHLSILEHLRRITWRTRTS